MKLINLAVALMAMFTMSLAVAEPPSLTAEDLSAETLIRQRMAENFPQKELLSIQAVAETRFFQVSFGDGLLLYVTPDASHFLVGSLYQSSEAGVVNVTEQLKQQQRAALLAQLRPQDYLSLQPQVSPAQAVVYVFVDIDCYYCQFQHQQSPQLLEHGVELRYLSLNRQQAGSSAYHKVRRTWCSDQPQQALDLLMQGRSVAEKQCVEGLMEKHSQLAQRLGVKRLPAVLMADGRLISGMLKDKQILNLLGIDFSDDLPESEPIAEESQATL